MKHYPNVQKSIEEIGNLQYQLKHKNIKYYAENIQNVQDILTWTSKVRKSAAKRLF